MIIVRLAGGLGNQMFQYAFGRCLAERRQAELKLDDWFFTSRLNKPFRTYDLGVFDIKESFATREERLALASRTSIDILDRVLNRLLGVKQGHIREQGFPFSQEAYDQPDNVYLSGYWQTEKYFKEIEDIIRREFTYKNGPPPEVAGVLDRIRQTNSVGVHVRRGDFLVNPLNGVYGEEYYSDAEAVVRSRVDSPAYFVFSDDIEWCRANLRFEGPAHFVTESPSATEDFRLLSACRHQIATNSSFSWWAAWLNPNADKTVVAPSRWFADASLDTRDLIPEKWIQI